MSATLPLRFGLAERNEFPLHRPRCADPPARVPGRHSAYDVDTITTIEKLDEEGYIHNPTLFGISGLVRMEYPFKRVPEGTLYENRLLVGGVAGWRRWVTPLMQRFGFDQAHGMARLRHNIEEVGAFEHILSSLYRQKTGQSE